MAFNYSPKIVTNGLVLCLDAGNPTSYTSGSLTWKDLSRGFNNGTLTNGPTFNSANGGSIVFDGVDDYVTVLNNPVLSTMSVSVWVRIKTISSNRYIFNKLPTVGNNSNYGLNIHSGGQTLNIESWNGSTASSFTSSYKPTTGSWFNVVAIYNTSSSGVFINGNLDVPGYISPINSGTRIDIGNNPLGTSSPLNADIATFQIYNRALSATEVLQNYNATKGRFGLT